MSELGEFKEFYKEIYSEEETNTGQTYRAYNKEYKRECFLKVIRKDNLKMGDYDLLLEQIIKSYI